MQVASWSSAAERCHRLGWVQWGWGGGFVPPFPGLGSSWGVMPPLSAAPRPRDAGDEGGQTPRMWGAGGMLGGVVPRQGAAAQPGPPPPGLTESGWKL